MQTTQTTVEVLLTGGNLSLRRDFYDFLAWNRSADFENEQGAAIGASPEHRRSIARCGRW